MSLRYSRFKSSREPRKEKPSQSLIDLDEDAVPQKELSSQLSALSVTGAAKGATASASASNHNEKEDSEFDMFAQSRNVTYETSKSG